MLNKHKSNVGHIRKRKSAQQNEARLTEKQKISKEREVARKVVASCSKNGFSSDEESSEQSSGSESTSDTEDEEENNDEPENDVGWMLGRTIYL